MTDPVWYYAHGDVEKGPLTTAQIKALAAAGKVRHDDLVWKEGMETWVAAGELAELFANSAAKPKEKPREADDSANAVTRTSIEHASHKFARRGSSDVLLRAARTTAVLGFSIILLLRGCDLREQSHVARLRADVAVQEHEHSKSIDATTEKAKPQQQDAGQKEAAQKLDGARAAVLKGAADLAKSRYSRSLIWMVASAMLAASLMVLARIGTRTERWIATAGLAALLLSLFCGPAFS
jgi:hypothetical protein